MAAGNVRVKVLLVNPSGPKPPPTYFGPPYGLAMVAACAEAAGHSVRCADLDRVPLERLNAEAGRLLDRFRPDVLGIGCQSSNRGAVYGLLESIRRRGRAPRMVAGGPFPSLEPGLFLRPDRADIVVVGEGERTFPELLDCLERGGDLRRVAGLAFRKGGRIVRTGTRLPVLDLDALPAPAFHLFDFAGKLREFSGPPDSAFASGDFVERARCATVVSALTFLGSRGCRYSCRFCPQSAVKVHKLREHSPLRFAAIVKGLRRAHRVRDFVFGDNNFTADRGRALAVCAELRRHAPGIRWVCMTRADAVDRELLRAMRRAGCVEISYGIESGSPRIQRAIGKGLRLSRAAEAFQATREAGIASVLMLMVGNPGESVRTIRETLSVVRDLEPDRILVKTTRVYPGTALHDAAVERGVIPPGFYEGAECEAPPYTGEHSLAGLRELKRMIPERRIFIALRKGAEASALRLALFAASRRCEDIVVDGRTMERRAVAGLMRDASRLGVHRLCLRLDPSFLARAGCAAALRRSGVEDVELCAGGVEELGAFEAAAGRWREAGGRCRVRLMLTDAVLRRLPDPVSAFRRAGVEQALLVFHRSPEGWDRLPVRACPRMADTAPRASDALARLEELGMDAALCGVPACIAGAGPRRTLEPYRPFDEAIGARGRPVKLSLRRAADKRRIPACGGCAEAAHCEGVWDAYLRFRGEDEFHAL